jgi:hypothetical protein
MTTFSLKVSPTPVSVFAVGALYAHRLQFAALLKDNRMGVTPPVRQLTIQRKESNAISELKTIN